VPRSKAPSKSLLTTYFTKQVWNYTSFQAFTAQVIQSSLWGYTAYSNKSIPAFENSMLPQYPGLKFVSGWWSDVEEEMCHYIQQLQWLQQIKAIELWMASLFLQNPGTNYVLILYIFIWSCLLFDRQFHFRFKNYRILIQYSGSISTLYFL
jgi:hypothetical protein